jgi:hypothetical protein
MTLEIEYIIIICIFCIFLLSIACWYVSGKYTKELLHIKDLEDCYRNQLRDVIEQSYEHTNYVHSLDFLERQKHTSGYGGI